MNSSKTPDQRFLDAKVALIMGTPDDELDEMLEAMGLDAKDLELRGTKAVEQALALIPEISNALSDLPLSKKKEVVQQLGIRHTILAGLVERRATLDTIPKRFIRALATAAEKPFDSIVLALTGPVRFVHAAHKSDEAPTVPSQVPFEKLLRDAAMSEEEIRKVMQEDD
jgi:hypothetical protein